MKHEHRGRSQHFWTVDEYERLEEGFICNRRVELLDGKIVEKPFADFRHAEAVDRLTEFFIGHARGRFRVRVQGPFILSGNSMPEPDICLLKNEVRHLRHHPKSDCVYLAVEVADSTLHYDQGDKKTAYARQEIPEYWVLNLRENHLEIYLNPQNGRYASVRTLSGEEFASPSAFPDLKLRVGDVIP